MTTNNITYLDQIIPNKLFVFSNPLIAQFHFNDTMEILLFLNSLEIDKVYVLTFYLNMSYLRFSCYYILKTNSSY
jgi:hypothetical protein